VAGLGVVAVLISIPRATEIRFVYSTDAQGLLEPMIDEFNATQSDIEVEGEEKPSGDVLRAILAGEEEELVLWMPAASTWGELLNHQSGAEVAPDGSRSFFWSPEVIGTFDSVIDDHPIGSWNDLAELAIGESHLVDDSVFRLGHSNPTSSTSGLYALVSEFSSVNADGRPTVDDRSSEQVASIEGSVLHYGDIAQDFCPKLFQYSSEYVSAFYMQEATFLKCEERFQDLGLVEVIPDRTFIADYPAFILEPWADEPKGQAAERFLEWLDRELDAEPILDEKFRFGDPWDSNGTTRDRAPTGADLSRHWEPLPVPPGETLSMVQDAWPQVRKAADVLILLEQGDMHVGSAIESAKALLRDFIEDLPDDARVGLDGFSERVVEVAPLRVLTAGARDDLNETLDGIGAVDADSFLADALVASLKKMDHPERISIIVLVSRGVDEGGRHTLDDVLSEIARLSGRTSPIQIYAVSYGDPDGDRILSAIGTDSLGGCSDATPDGNADGCGPLKPSDLLHEAAGSV
jgi:Bacterial extracellular solute-binding protein/von Willebrand factor type A domain